MDQPLGYLEICGKPAGEIHGKGAGRGAAFKEQQFMIGVPASEMGHEDSEELVLVQGVIDAFIEEPEGLLLIDYKTDRISGKDKEMGKERLKERYRTQIDCYERALCQITGENGSAKVYLLLCIKRRDRDLTRNGPGCIRLQPGFCAQRDGTGSFPVGNCPW